MTECPPLFVRYVPRAARRLLHGCSALHEPRIARFPACVLLADVSGFTTVVERLARTDPQRGAERLQETLNRCFGSLTEVVEAAGGEILKFPGDAALGLWTAEDVGPAALGDLVHRAAACGLSLRSALEGLAFGDGAAIRLRVVIGAGEASAAIVGGIDGRWEFVVQGAAIDQLNGALQAAQPGDVVMSRAATALAGSAIDGAWRGDAFVVARATPPSHTPARAVDEGALSHALLRAFVPRPVQARIDAGQAAWLAEFRTATVMFLNLGRPGPEGESLHHTMREVQSVVGRFGGSVNQLVSDDKGTTIVIGFGVALRVHEDDGARALKAGLEIRDRLSGIGVTVRIGVTTGRVFTGTRGGGSRLEFALIGASVNLAARLSAIADDMLCDEATRGAAHDMMEFDAAGEVIVKGTPTPVPVHRPRSARARTSPTHGGPQGLVGRVRERLAIEQRLASLAASHQGGVIFVVGEPGIGKSTLVGHALGRCRDHGVTAIVGAADSIERTTSYLAWRPIVATLLGADADADAIPQRLERLVGPTGPRHASLLNPVLAAPLPETAETSGLNAENRARLTRELLAGMVTAASRSNPLLIVLEDAHWMDSASWELAEAVVAATPRTLVLLTHRTVTDPDKAHRRLSERPEAMTIRLDALDRADIRAVICRRLGVAAIPDEVAVLIENRAEGQPLFAEELVLALRDSKLVEVEGGVCRVHATGRDLSSFPFPETVNGVVAGRIDRLSPQEQLTLKVASVLGRRFTLEDLTRIHPLAESGDALAGHVAQIAALGLLQPHDPEAACSFSHAVVHDVAYELLPFAQRRGLHRATAEWFEQRAGPRAHGLSPLLAHHWERAEVTGKAMAHLEIAGEQALYRDGANREAADFLGRLLALAESSADGEPAEIVDVPGIGLLGAHAVDRARWEHMLSQALFRQGQHKPMLPHLEKCLALLRQSFPRRTSSMQLEFARGVLVRLAVPPRRPRLPRQSPGVLKALLAVVRTYETLGVTSYYTGNVVQGRLALLRSVRWAERVGASAELSRAYSTFAIVMGVFHRPALARRYMSLARTVAEQVGDKHALFVALGRGQLPLFIIGAWQEASASLEQANQLGREAGDLHGQQVNEYQLARIRFNQGHLGQALDDFRRLLSSARESEAAVNQLWALAGISEALFRLGRWDDAIESAEETLHLAERVDTTDENARFEACGVLAACWLRKAGPDRAQAYLAPAIAAGKAGGRSSYAPQVGFSGVAEILLSSRDEKTTKGWLQIMRLEGFFKPILQPWYLIFRAAHDRQRHRPRRAMRHLRRAIALAERMALPYESAQARAELARTLGVADPEREAQKAEARRIFAEIGAVGELQRVL